MRDDLRGVEEQRALRVTEEAVRTAQALRLLTPAMEKLWQGNPANRTS